jgi:hypothetical protein
MQTLTPQDLNYVVRRIPKDVRELLQAHTLFVGGGFIRETIAGSDDVRDIDLFGTSKDALQALAALFTASRKGAAQHKTDNAITVLCPPRMPVQFITRWTFSEAEPLVKSFDFTVCQAVIWYDQGARAWCSMVGDGFYPDLAARRLVYTFPVREEEAGGSLMRVVKFLKRGYTVQATTLGGVIARVVVKVRESHLTATEQGTAQVITGLLHEVDPLLVVDGLEPVDEHAAI